VHSVALDALLPAPAPDAANAESVPSITVQQTAEAAAQWVEPPDDPAALVDLAALPETGLQDDALPEPPTDEALAVVPSPAESWGLSKLPWLTLIPVLWLTGSVVWLLLAAWRTWRFHQLLHHARLGPPSLQQEARRLARHLGLNDSPRVWLVPGRVSPMLWALDGTPRLLLPAE